MRISDWSSDVCSSDLAAFLLIGTQPEEIGVVHQNEPLVRTAQAQAASAEPCPMIVDSQGEVQPPIMIGERPVEAGQSIDVPAEPGNTSEASPDEIIVIARGEAPQGDPLQNVNIEAFQELGRASGRERRGKYV